MVLKDVRLTNPGFSPHQCVSFYVSDILGIAVHGKIETYISIPLDKLSGFIRCLQALEKIYAPQETQSLNDLWEEVKALAPDCLKLAEEAIRSSRLERSDFVNWLQARKAEYPKAQPEPIGSDW